MTDQIWPVAAATGHRDMRAELTTFEHARLHTDVYEVVRRLRDEHGTRVGISGLAIGFDTIWAEAILDHGLALWAFCPGPWQADQWSPVQQRTWERLRAQATVVKEDFSPTFSNAAYHARDRAMFDEADVGVTCWLRHRMHGGTYQTLKYAIGQRHLPVIHIDTQALRTTEPADRIRLPREEAWYRALDMQREPATLFA